MADVIEKLFSLFCPTWRTILKMFAKLFRLVGAVYKQEKEETETSRHMAK